MLDPWIDALDDKRLLAVIHCDQAEKELAGAMRPEDWRLLRRAVPPTWRVDAASAQRLKGRERRERRFYLKRGRSAMSRALVDGQQVNRGAFDRAVDKAVLEGDWVAQEAVRGAPWRFDWLDADANLLRTMDGYVRLTPIYTRTLAGSVRLADVCITARPQRSRVHGASDACLVVPGPAQ
jgi:hypothetical protein